MNRKSFIASLLSLFALPWRKKTEAVPATKRTNIIQIEFEEKDGSIFTMMKCQFGDQHFSALLPQEIFPESPYFPTLKQEDREAIVGSLLERASKCMLWERHGKKFCGAPKHGIDSEYDEDFFPL